jgi:hypothetical protein
LADPKLTLTPDTDLEAGKASMEGLTFQQWKEETPAAERAAVYTQQHAFIMSNILAEAAGQPTAEILDETIELLGMGYVDDHLVFQEAGDPSVAGLGHGTPLGMGVIAPAEGWDDHWGAALIGPGETFDKFFNDGMINGYGLSGEELEDGFVFGAVVGDNRLDRFLKGNWWDQPYGTTMSYPVVFGLGKTEVGGSFGLTKKLLGTSKGAQMLMNISRMSGNPVSHSYRGLRFLFQSQAFLNISRTVIGVGAYAALQSAVEPGALQELETMMVQEHQDALDAGDLERANAAAVIANAQGLDPDGVLVVADTVEDAVVASAEAKAEAEAVEAEPSTDPSGTGLASEAEFSGTEAPGGVGLYEGDRLPPEVRLRFGRNPYGTLTVGQSPFILGRPLQGIPPKLDSDGEPVPRTEAEKRLILSGLTPDQQLAAGFAPLHGGPGMQDYVKSRWLPKPTNRQETSFYEANINQEDIGAVLAGEPMLRTPGWRHNDWFSFLGRLTQPELVSLQNDLVAANRINMADDGQAHNLGMIDAELVGATADMMFEMNLAGDKRNPMMHASNIADSAIRRGISQTQVRQPGRAARAPFYKEAYIGPDYDTLSQTAKQASRQQLGRDLNEAEIVILADKMKADDRAAFDMRQKARRANYDAAGRGGDAGFVGETEDVQASFQEFFDNKYAGEIQRTQDVAQVYNSTRNLFGGLDNAAQLIGR